jgi:hypothetical protein
VAGLILEHIPSAQKTSKLARKSLKDRKDESAEQVTQFSIPSDASNAFPDLFSALDLEIKGDNILYYGLSTPTLEEVFLKSEYEDHVFDRPTEDEPATVPAATAVEINRTLLTEPEGWYKRILPTVFSPLLVF